MVTMESVVCGGAENALLARLTSRTRILGKYVAAHPVTVERVLRALDVSGPSEAGDVIHSLLWACVEAQHRAAVMADMLAEIDATPNANVTGLAPGKDEQ